MVNTISKPKEKPKLKVSWWAMSLSLLSMLMIPVLNLFNLVIRPMISGGAHATASAIVGTGLGFLSPALAIAALVTSIYALAKGERSWVVWVGLIPAILVCAFWIFLVLGEIFTMK